MENSSKVLLIAVAVLIVILLITVSIKIFSSPQDVQQQATDVGTLISEKMEEGTQYLSSSIPGGTIKIPEGLKIGEEVTYTPSGEYKWQAKYYSSTKKDDVTLKSSEYSFKISKWKVFKIDEKTGEVLLVPSVPTTGTVYLGQEQGYNNGVKLLNDACSALYGNSSKNITARSINIEDIEKVADFGTISYTNSDGVKYGERYTSSYTSNKAYPKIYASEKYNSIDIETQSETGLNLSEQTSFIGRGGNSGKEVASSYIWPRQTYYYYNYSSFSEKLGSTYSSILLPKKTGTHYWVASRCVNPCKRYCYFNIRYVYYGSLNASGMYIYGINTGYNKLPLFPVVSLSSNLIIGDKTSGFKVEQ